jgi:secondary thiamine-phosphate synthase enzyme
VDEKIVEIRTERIQLKTKGPNDIINITGELAGLLEQSRLSQGQMSAFVIGSTAALATCEYEPGLVKDLQELYERIAPERVSYHHDETWGDANGFSHVRAALQGPCLTIPFEGGKLLLGTWQQVVLLECDTRSRRREVVVQLIGK